MKKRMVLVFVAFLAAGCVNPWTRMERYFVNEKTRIEPADNYERAVAEYASFKLYQRREASFEEFLMFPELLLKNPLHPEWIFFLFHTAERWEFRPAGPDKFEGVVYFRKPPKDTSEAEVARTKAGAQAGGWPHLKLWLWPRRPQYEVAMVTLTNDEMLRLARDVVASRKAFLAFLKKHVPDYKFQDIRRSARFVRNALLKDLLTSSVPADIGERMVPVLIEAAEKGYYPRFCVQSLQIITGQSFDYPPIAWTDPKSLVVGVFVDPKETVTFRMRQRKAIKRWRSWYEKVHGENEKSASPRDSSR